MSEPSLLEIDQYKAFLTLDAILANLKYAQNEQERGYRRYLLERQEGQGYLLMQVLERIMKAKSHEEYMKLMSQAEWSKLFFSDVRGQTYRALDGSLMLSVVVGNLNEIREIMLKLHWDIAPQSTFEFEEGEPHGPQ